MTDQAEDIRRRLEARQGGKPYVPPPSESVSESSLVSKPTAPLAPQTQALARRRKVEAAINDIGNAQPVVIVDIKMKFLSMVMFMVKWAFATIPAVIIIAVITWLLFILIGVLFHS